MSGVRKLRGSFGLAVLILTVTAADADADDSRTTGRCSATAPPPAPLPAPGPAVGTLNESELELYLFTLEERVRAISRELRAAHACGDEHAAARLGEELHVARAFHRAERERLAGRRPALIGAGIGLVAIGGVSVAISAVGLLARTLASDGGRVEPPIEAVAVGFGVGAFGLGAGIPMIVVGAKPHPKASDPTPAATLLPSMRPLTVGWRW